MLLQMSDPIWILFQLLPTPYSLLLIEPHCIVDLRGNRYKSETGVELLANGILLKCFDFGDLHASFAKEGKRVLQHCLAEPLTLMFRINRQIYNPPGLVRSAPAIA